MKARRFELPPFWCPTESAIHPQAGEAEQRAISWIDEFGFCESEAERAWVIGTSSADFCSRFAPNADLDRLMVAVYWTYWAFAFDDARCDEGEYSTQPARFAALAGRIQRALETPGSFAVDSEDPYAAGVHDIGERLRRHASPTQARRFIHAHRTWLFGVQWQIGNRARGYMPTLDEYLNMRLYAVGGEPTFASLEISDNAEVPSQEMDLPVVRALTEMAILVAALDNDRHSFAKEYFRGQDEQNIFNVLMQQNRLPIKQAVDEAIALRDRIFCRFLRLRDEIMPTASQELRRYLTNMGNGVRGNAEWGLRAARYLSLNDATTGPGQIVVPEQFEWAGYPLDSNPEPPPLPSISWWWEV